MKCQREQIDGWPSWLPKATPCVSAGKGQWKRARKLLASDDEGSETCAIVSGRGVLVGLVTLDGREAWVRGEHVQPRRPGPGGWTARVRPYNVQTITLPPRSSVLSGQMTTFWRMRHGKPVTIVPHAGDTDPEISECPLASPLGEVIDINACATFVRVGAGWRKIRAKLRSWLMRFADWGSV